MNTLPVTRIPACGFVVAALLMSGCARQDSVESAPAPASSTAPDTAAPAAAQSKPLNETAAPGTPVDPSPLQEKLQPDDPAAGMNNRRPDSQKDIEPEPGSPQPPP
jgi:hypothetical protein